MIRLADQYQVTRFMAAASSCFESLPLSAITQGVMLEVRAGLAVQLCLSLSACLWACAVPFHSCPACRSACPMRLTA
jgi:hypothetical protein